MVKAFVRKSERLCATDDKHFSGKSKAVPLVATRVRRVNALAGPQPQGSLRLPSLSTASGSSTRDHEIRAVCRSSREQDSRQVMSEVTVAILTVVGEIVSRGRGKVLKTWTRDSLRLLLRK
jgi:hypothetical protein